MEEKRNAKQIYDKAIESRSQYVDRAEEISSLTIPYLMPRKGHSPSSTLEDSIMQSDMATNINSLTSKITMTLFPTAASSFRLTPDAEGMAIIMAQAADSKAQESTKQQIYMGMSSATARINRELEAQDIRPQVFGFIRDIMTIGAVIIEKVKNKGIKYHGLASIGVRLDDKFEPYEMAILEILTKLPEGISVKEEADAYELYTSMYIDDDGKWVLIQSIGDEEVGVEKKFTDETLPFQYLGWSIAKGDTYHRPYSEQQMGNIRSFNALAEVLTQGAVIASKSLIFVDPRGGRTKMRDVADAPNGQIIEGRADDVTSFQLEKNFDFQVPMQRFNDLKMSLEKAYLVNQSAVRNSERTTLGEISFTAQDLETQLAGIYSIMAEKVSKRVISWIMQELNIKFEGTDVNIITGLDSLSRTSEAQKMDTFMQTMVSLGYNGAIKESEVVQRYADFYGINTEGLIKTQQEISAEQEQQSERMMAEQGMESLMNESGKAALGQPTQQ